MIINRNMVTIIIASEVSSQQGVYICMGLYHLTAKEAYSSGEMPNDPSTTTSLACQ